MSRVPRVDIGDEIYHVLNRSNGRVKIFNNDKDYKNFVDLLIETKEKFDMRILAYCIMPNHWHLVLYPKKDGDLSKFMQWLSLTHTQRYHVKTETVGFGHLYQGRYKSFLVSRDNYLLQVIRYVEQNPLRAKIVKRAEDWKWGSGFNRFNPSEKNFVSECPIDLPNDYRQWLNEVHEKDELENIRLSVEKSKPFGTISWVDKMVETFKLGLTTRLRGRPTK
ncbi:MAG: transposase [Minisyncoccia bacterium]